jgi:uncharacterized membrane protein YoaK (UPF0700 family)
MSEAVRKLWPWAGSGHGPLPQLLVLLTVVTGLVDAVSYLTFGHVFVANMTGNVVFLGFALAGAHGLSSASSLVALATFLLGAFAGGRLAARTPEHRGHMLRSASIAQVLLLALALAVAVASGEPLDSGARYALLVPMALAMGVQNAAAQRLAVPELTTTVLTRTLTGIASEAGVAGASGAKLGRRVLAVAAMLIGALAGGLLVLHVSIVSALALAGAIVLAAAFAIHLVSHTDAPWTQA